MDNRVVELNVNLDKEINQDLIFKQFDTTELKVIFNGDVDLKDKIVNLIWKNADGSILLIEATTIDYINKIAVFLLKKVNVKGKVRIEIQLLHEQNLISSFITTAKVQESLLDTIDEEQFTIYWEKVEKTLEKVEKYISNNDQFKIDMKKLYDDFLTDSNNAMNTLRDLITRVETVTQNAINATNDANNTLDNVKQAITNANKAEEDANNAIKELRGLIEQYEGLVTDINTATDEAKKATENAETATKNTENALNNIKNFENDYEQFKQEVRDIIDEKIDGVLTANY